jgi:hypothetical protein
VNNECTVRAKLNTYKGIVDTAPVRMCRVSL